MAPRARPSGTSMARGGGGSLGLAEPGSSWPRAPLPLCFAASGRKDPTDRGRRGCVCRGTDGPLAPPSPRPGPLHRAMGPGAGEWRAIQGGVTERPRHTKDPHARRPVDAAVHCFLLLPLRAAPGHGPTGTGLCTRAAAERRVQRREGGKGGGGAHRGTRAAAGGRCTRAAARGCVRERSAGASGPHQGAHAEHSSRGLCAGTAGGSQERKGI